MGKFEKHRVEILELVHLAYLLQRFEKDGALPDSVSAKDFVHTSLENLLQSNLASVSKELGKVICIVAHLEYHGKDVGSVALVEVPVIADTDFELFDLYLFINKPNVWYEIWAELHALNDLIKEVLKWRYEVSMVV